MNRKRVERAIVEVSVFFPSMPRRYFLQKGGWIRFGGRRRVKKGSALESELNQALANQSGGMIIVASQKVSTQTHVLARTQDKGDSL